MGLIDQFNNLVRRLRPAAGQTTSDEVEPARPVQAAPDLYARFKVGQGRTEMVRDVRRMYKEDTRASGIIEALARDATRGGFTLTVSEGSERPRAQAVADELVQRLGLFQRLDDWSRLTFRDGDSFLELGVDRAGLIQLVTRKPTLEMHRNSNAHDRFEDPTRAFWWSEVPWSEPGRDAIWFADWQIVHARWGHDEGSRYGRPLFASGRKAFKRIEEGERDIAVRRKTRAGMVYVHKVPGGADAIEAYKAQNTKALNNLTDPVREFIGNVDLTTLQGDSRVAEIGDVEHHIETWAIGAPVPLASIGYGKNINRDILKEKQEQYEDALDSVAEWVTDQLVQPLLEMQWLLQGIWPAGLAYEVRWQSKKSLSAETLKSVAEAALKLKAMQWPDDVIIDLVLPLLPGLDAERLKAAMAALAAGQPDEIGRMSRDAG